MSTAVRPLADRIEADIHARTIERVDAALAQARDIAHRAYANAFRSVCGVPFDVVLADVMSQAEASIREQAIVAAERIEIETILRHLAAHVEGSPQCNR